MRCLALLMLAVCACGIGPAPLPVATADIAGKHVSLPRGSYCWSSWGHGECADSTPPDELLRSGYLKPIIAAGGESVNVAFSSSPKSVSLQLLWTSSGQPSSVIEGHRIPFNLPAGPGTYVFVVTGTWHEGDVGFFLPVEIARQTAP
jgi:hypothetical protein